MIEEAAFENQALTLEPGDRLYFYTDGATEALSAGEEEFGSDRLLEDLDRWRDRPLREDSISSPAPSAPGAAAA